MNDYITLGDVIAQLDQIKPNQYDLDTKVRWLNDVEGQLVQEIFSWHAGTENLTFPHFNSADLTQILLVPAPYHDLYVKYLCAQVDFANAEFNRYNNSMTLYNALLSSFADWYNRTHVPAQPNYIRGVR